MLGEKHDWKSQKFLKHHYEDNQVRKREIKKCDHYELPRSVQPQEEYSWRGQDHERNENVGLRVENKNYPNKRKLQSKVINEEVLNSIMIIIVMPMIVH